MNYRTKAILIALFLVCILAVGCSKDSKESSETKSPSKSGFSMTLYTTDDDGNEVVTSMTFETMEEYLQYEKQQQQLERMQNMQNELQRINDFVNSSAEEAYQVSDTTDGGASGKNVI